MSQVGRDSSEPAEFGPSSRDLAGDDVPDVRQSKLPRVQEAGLGRVSFVGRPSSESAALLRTRSCKARGASLRLGGATGLYGGASSISPVQSFAEDVGSILTRTGGTSDAFQRVVNFNRSKDVELLRWGRLVDSSFRRASLRAEHFSGEARPARPPHGRNLGGPRASGGQRINKLFHPIIAGRNNVVGRSFKFRARSCTAN